MTETIETLTEEQTDKLTEFVVDHTSEITKDGDATVHDGDDLLIVAGTHHEIANWADEFNVDADELHNEYRAIAEEHGVELPDRHPVVYPQPAE